MSMLSKSSSSSNMGSSPSFHELKKQASFFFKEKIKNARLALTDVTSAQLLTEEAISGNPDARTLSSISKAAFELDDFTRIVAILHHRLLKFEKKYWRLSYNTLIIVEHLLTHGPESVSQEFQSDKDTIEQMGSFQYVDEKGFNWGIAVRRKSERVLNLLANGALLKQERERARKLTREIQGFGSFSSRSSSMVESPAKYGKCNSNFNSAQNEVTENSSFGDSEEIENELPETQELVKGKLVWRNGETKSLLNGEREEMKGGMWGYDHHPFNEVEIQTTVSLLSG